MNELTLLPTTDFETFWNLYDKKVGMKEKLIRKWNRLTETEKQLAIEYIPKYKLAQPDKQYRKNPETFLNNKSWNDEIIESANWGKSQPNLADIAGKAYERAFGTV